LFKIFCIALMLVIQVPSYADPDTSGGSKVLLEGFEHLDRKVSVNSAAYEITNETESLNPGRSSIGLSYRPSSGSGYIKIQKEFPAPLNWKDFKAVSMYVLGDASGDDVSVKFKNGSDDIWRSQWVKVDWTGWRQVVFDLSGFKLDLFDADGGPGNRSMRLEEVKALAIAVKGARNSKLIFDEISLISDNKIDKIKLAGEYEPPAGCFLWKVDMPGGRDIEYPAPKDWSEASGTSFIVEGNSSGEECALVVTDNDGELYSTPRVKVVWSGPKKFYYDFDLFERVNPDGVKGGDGVFGQKGIRSVSFRGPKGTRLDDLRLAYWKEIKHSSAKAFGGYSSNGKAYLYWDLSSHPFLSGFNVYRDSIRIAATASPFYSEDVGPGAKMHKYGVSAVYTDGMESDVISLDIAFSSNKPVSRKERVAVKGDWIYVDGERFFVKGKIYEPSGAVEDDMSRIKRAGFNTIRAKLPFSERDLIIAGKFGLMVVQPLDVKDTKYADEVAVWSRRHENILYYVTSCSSPVIPDHADPERFISIEYSEGCGCPPSPQVNGIAGIGFPSGGAAANENAGDYVNWFKNSFSKGVPLIVDMGEGEAGANSLSEMIAAGASGVYVAGHTAAVSVIFRDFWPHYARFSGDSPYDGLSVLEIRTDRKEYTAGQKPKLSFFLKRKKGSPAVLGLDYIIRDINNNISKSYSVNFNGRGAYKTSFTLPYNIDDTMFLISAAARMSGGKRAFALKYINVSENKALKDKFKSKVRVSQLFPYELRYTASGIKIDGLADDAWNTAAVISIDSSMKGKPILRTGDYNGDKDLSGKVRLLWDRNNLYVLADIKDDMPMVNNKYNYNLCNGDALELFLSLDPDLLAKDGYSASDFQVAFGANERMWIFGQANGGVRNSPPRDSEIKTRKTDSGYILEARISLSNFGLADFSNGRELGLDLAVDDADGTGNRECRLIWNGSEDNDRVSKHWGRAVLAGGQ